MYAQEYIKKNTVAYPKKEIERTESYLQSLEKINVLEA